MTYAFASVDFRRKALSRSEPHGRWLWRHGSGDDGVFRLFCVPCAGHGAFMYRRWPIGLPREIEVWALQAPGRENRLDEGPFDDLASLVRAAAIELEPLLDECPYAFVGHSMGALIAFELAREFRRRSKRLPSHLFVSGRSAPQAVSTGVIRHRLPDPMFLESVQQLNTELAHDDEYREAMRAMLPTLRADFRLCERYQYVQEAPLACGLSAWGGRADPEASLLQLVGWREQTTANFALTMFPGDHFFLATQRKAVLRTLAKTLEPLLAITAGRRVGAALV